MVYVALFFALTASTWAGESRSRIVVVDTGITPSAVSPEYICRDGNKDFTGKGLADIQGHGSNIAAIIAKAMNPKTQCLTILKWWHDESDSNRPETDIWSAIYARIMNLKNVRFINLSSYGPYASESEWLMLTYFTEKRHIQVVVAAGNKGKWLGKGCATFPACYDINNNWWHVVGSQERPAQWHSFSNRGSIVTDAANGANVTAGGSTLSGTSQACALVTARLVKADGRRW